MKNKYELLINLDKITKNVYEKYYRAENFDIILNEAGILFARKINNLKINMEHEKIITEVVISIAKKYKLGGVIHIDLSNEIESIMDNIKFDKNIRHTDNRITWPIRQAFTKAIIEKKKKEV